MQEGEIAALKQDLKKQQEQAEKWVMIFHSLLHNDNIFQDNK